MPYLLEDLIVDRVDFVDEGANSAAFIELFKRKETHEMTFTEILEKMKSEHAEIINAEIASLKKAAEDASEELRISKETLSTVSDELTRTKTELEEALASEEDDPKTAGRATTSFDEDETFKTMPEAVKELFEKLKVQKESAETELRKAKEAELEATALSKATSLKNLPVETSALAQVLKGASSEMIDMLTSINAAIEASVLNEIGKNGAQASTSTDSNAAWVKIEEEAAKVAKKNKCTIQKAISTVIEEQPDLYRDYLNGGAN